MSERSESNASNCSGEWVRTYDAALARGLYPSTFRRRAIKAGVRFRMGSRIWDGYTWNPADLHKLMPLNREADAPGGA